MRRIQIWLDPTSGLNQEASWLSIRINHVHVRIHARRSCGKTRLCGPADIRQLMGWMRHKPGGCFVEAGPGGPETDARPGLEGGLRFPARNGLERL